MAKSLRINEKEYLPSVELARQFSYTSDYISKLARDEKVLATRVGRQWFIEPESLHVFTQQLEVEKRLRHDELSRQRKLERVSTEEVTKTRPGEISSLADHASALAQAVVVLVCGLLVGVMSWQMNSNELTLSDLQDGAQVAFGSITAHVLPDTLPSILVKKERGSESLDLVSSVNVSKELGKTAAVVGPRFEEVGSYTTFPGVTSTTGTDSLLGNDGMASSTHAGLSVHSGAGNEVIKPVFRRSTGNEYDLIIETQSGNEQNE